MGLSSTTRMRAALMLPLLSQRQDDGERASFAHLALDADAAALHFDNLARQRQTQSRALVTPRRARIQSAQIP